MPCLLGGACTQQLAIIEQDHAGSALGLAICACLCRLVCIVTLNTYSKVFTI
jgi:hypothetical protein